MPAGANSRGQLGVPVIAVAEDLPGGVVDQLGDQLQVVDVGRGQAEGGDDARPAGAQMGAEAINGGLAAVVIAEGAPPPESASSDRPGRSDRPAPAHYRQTTAPDRGRSDRAAAARAWLLDRPQVGGVPGEGGAMHCRRPGNQSGCSRRKYGKRAVSRSRPRYSPTTSIVSTSLSARVGAGPRLPNPPPVRIGPPLLQHRHQSGNTRL